LSTPQPAYSPVLTAAPYDWTIGISYNFPVAPTGYTTIYPKTMAIDVNDNVYVANNDVLGTNIMATNLYAFTSNGYNTYINQALAGVSGATYMRDMTVDNAGNVWAQNPGHLYKLSSATGAYIATVNECEGQIYGVVSDLANNIWSTGNSATTNICELPAGSTATALVADFTTTSGANGPGGNDITVDRNQNIWVAGGYNTGDAVVVIPNVGTVTSPSYNTTQSASVKTGTGFAFTGFNSVAAGLGQPTGIAVDSSGNAWSTIQNNNVGIAEVTPISTSGVITSLPPAVTNTYTGNTFTGPGRMEVDGAGVAWMSDNNSGGIVGFNTVTGTYIKPSLAIRTCVIASGATVCSNGFGANTHLHVDSTGSLWVLNSNATGTLIQDIGLANPTWPWIGMGGGTPQ
jgi:hypothetical protein